jgi:hypothetical protein
VRAVGGDGSMRVRRENGRGEVTLPAAYVRHHVELGYAATAYRAQGRTVDAAHAIVGATTTREVLYVAATRGREANTIYVEVTPESDPDTSHCPGEERGPSETLRAVLDNVGADASAHTVIERELKKAVSVAHVAAEYQTIARPSPNLPRIDHDDLDRALVERAGTLSRLGALAWRPGEPGQISPVPAVDSHDI